MSAGKLRALPLCSVLGLLLLVVFSPNTFSGDIYNPIKVKIVMKKHIFEVGEKIDGKIVIVNDYPANIPATFKVSLYHGEKLIRENFTAIKHVFTGETDFSLKNFGVPDFNRESSSVGTWRLSVIQRSVSEAYSTEAEFEIVPARHKRRK